MRIYLDLDFEKLELPIHYNHILQSIIINMIDSSGYRKFIHDEGYVLGKRKFKLYTFSRLLGKFQIFGNKIAFFNGARLIISSLDDAMVEYIINYILKKGYINVLGEKIYVKAAVLKSLPSANYLRVSTKSPVVVYSTLFNYENKKETIFYEPDSSKFLSLVYENILKKYTAFYGSISKNNIEIKHVGKNPKRVKVVYKNTVIFGWLTAFDIYGDFELLKVAYDAGIGMKNSMGFGCVELI
ncbi:cas crispr-associated protein Cas6 [Thermosipho africanus TCF52B]|uniref:CRISPR-associated endoribonuclease n=1 Tax=Thermosipho africanus (strain TCF52B) TaxID=484019 RepID=B7IFF1_THEAB|nr:CRISPR-associated endoribonuclease Cas6 [Thermosipho africanus]ACJ74815.1 cas crispr-associated protein Cas6 [Thermosipho africanus TCF52B]